MPFHTAALILSQKPATTPSAAPPAMTFTNSISRLRDAVPREQAPGGPIPGCRVRGFLGLPGGIAFSRPILRRPSRARRQLISHPPKLLRHGHADLAPGSRAGGATRFGRRAVVPPLSPAGGDSSCRGLPAAGERGRGEGDGRVRSTEYGVAPSPSSPLPRPSGPRQVPAAPGRGRGGKR